MANKVKAEDLVEKDVFKNTIDSATKLLTLTKEVKADFTGILKASQEIIAANPFQNSKDFQDYTKEAEKIKVVMKELDKLTKEEIKLSTQVGLARSEEAKRIALLKEQKKAINKEAAIEAKLISNVTTQYEKNRIELKKLTGELQNLKPGSKEFQELALRAGVLKDQIQDAKDAVKAFANESKTATAKNLFSQIGRDILDLDFKGASDKAKILAEVVRSITFGELATQAKALGATLLDLGKAVISNSLFLIATAITAIGSALYATFQSYKQAANEAERFTGVLNKQRESAQGLTEDIIALQIENDRLSGKISDRRAKELLQERKYGAERAKLFQDFATTVQDIEKRIEEAKAKRLAAARIGGSVGDTELIEQLESELKQLEIEFYKELADIRKKNELTLSNIRLEQERKDFERRQRNYQSIQHETKKQEEIINNEVVAANEKKEEEIDKHFANLKIKVVKSNNEILEEDKKTLEKEKAERDKFFNDSIRVLQEFTNRRKQAEIDAQDAIIQKTEKNIDRQVQLAAAGLDNTLAYEKENLAKAELEKRRLQEEQEKRLRRQNFYRAFGAYLENAQSNSEVAQAAFKALAQTVLADALAGAFKDGVEDFKGKGTETSDSNVVLLSKGESVLKAKAQKEVPGLVTALNKEGLEGAERWFMENMSPVLKQNNITHSDNSEVVSELRQIKKKLNNGAGQTINWNSHGEMIDSKIKDGVRRTIRHVRSKPRLC